MKGRKRPAQAVQSLPKITIIGAGPVGTLLAIMLARAGGEVRLIERRSDPRLGAPEGGRSINLALAARGLAALDSAGLLARLRPEMVEMRGRQLHDLEGKGPLLLYGQHPGEVIQAISRAGLNTALIEAAAELPAIQMVFGRRCLDVDPHAGRLHWQDEASGATGEETAELLIAADGAGSAMRQALATRGVVQAREEALAHHYMEFLIPAGPGGVWAFAPHALHIWPRGGFMLIALPNPDGSFTATLFLAAQGEPGFSALSTPRAAHAFFAEQFPDALALLPDFETQFAQHPQGQLGTLYCWPWQAGRVLLIGDAAHAIVPFHGQGLNCGFEDCALLTGLLLQSADWSTALASFERLRRPNTDAIATMAIENYQEMRASVLAPAFAARRQLALDLERRFPGRFVPRYSLVMFHAEIPYAEALRRGALQESVLDALLAARVGAASALAASLVDDSGL